MDRIKKIFNSKAMVSLIWVIGFFAIWEIGAGFVAASPDIRTPENVLPHFWDIIASMLDSKKVNGTDTALGLVLLNAQSTLIRSAEGFIIGLLAGFVLALFMSLSGAVEKIAFPYLMLIQMIPVLGMAPIILAITGNIDSARIIIAAILTFYPVATNTLAGFKAVEEEKHELMFSYAANKFQIYTKTMIPSSIPYLFTGLKIAALV